MTTTQGLSIYIYSHIHIILTAGFDLIDEEMTEEIGSTSKQLPPVLEDIRPLKEQEQSSPETSTPGANNTRHGPNLPCQDLLTGARAHYLKTGIPLYEASIKCDWKAAKAILDKSPELVRYGITENGETALHVAASAKVPKKMGEVFVKNLVDLMEKEDLALENKNFNTALSLAAAAGNLETIKIMVQRNRYLLTVPGTTGQMLPLYLAALFGNYDVVQYLYENSDDLCDDAGWTYQNRGWLLEKCVENDMFDIALEIVKKYPKLRSGNVLALLARKPEAFHETQFTIKGRVFKLGKYILWRTIDSVFTFSGSKVKAPENISIALQLLRIIWEDIANKPKNEIDTILRGPPDFNISRLLLINLNKQDKKYSSRVLSIAAEMGNTKFLVELIRKYPDLIWKVNDENHTIFHIAVRYRHAGIYNLLYEIGAMKDLITPLRDPKGNNMLHLVGMLATYQQLEDVSGDAFLMQRELLWFEEVKKMIPPSYRERKNSNGLTPHEVFTKEHAVLVSKGEKWMKTIAAQCIVVAALIATMVFAAAFTVPGGYDQVNGIPIFHSKLSFQIFVVADAISLFLSTASILYMFLSVFTSRYAERDFLVSVPKKLIVGLTYLFLSITSMMIAFCTGFYILYQKGLLWMPILISLFALIPFFLYIKVQLFLFVDVILSTFSSRHLFDPKKRVLYYDNPKV